MSEGTAGSVVRLTPIQKHRGRFDQSVAAVVEGASQIEKFVRSSVEKGMPQPSGSYPQCARLEANSSQACLELSYRLWYATKDAGRLVEPEDEFGL